MYIANCIYVTVYLTSKENTQIILQCVKIGLAKHDKRGTPGINIRTNTF
jgi:hypothetical protein